MKRQRADLLMVERGLAESRARAQALIIAGAVRDTAGRRIEKPGQMLDPTTEIELQHQPLPYVSRGGLKLAAALDHFEISVADRVCLDVGASTGGFTDCLLKNNARCVYAVDVGYGQMAWSLRTDPRVVLLERTNIRTMEPSQIAELCQVIVIDVSFISLRLVIPRTIELATPEADLVALVKPQFEVGRHQVGKGGIVRDPAARQQAVADAAQLAQGLGLQDIRWTESPIRGAKGNIEFLLSAKILRSDRL